MEDATQRHVLGHFDVSPAYISTKVVEEPQWQKVSGTFTADATYAYLLIGNFLEDERITSDQSTMQLDYGFYLVDDVLVRPLAPDSTAMFTINETFVLEHILFDFNKAELKASAYTELDQLVTYLQDYPSITLTITGHTDNEGTEAYNLDLSKRRAEAVKAYLTKQGIATDRIVTEGKGSLLPIVKNDSDGNKQLNRRVEVLLQE